MREKLESIANWLNRNYDQRSENYSIFFGAKPDVIRHDKETAISLWACGAIVCIGDQLSFISEDDGNWWVDGSHDEKDSRGFYNDYGYQSSFSIGWAESFYTAMKNLKEYVEKNGKPVYFSGTDTICHYRLGDD